MNGRQCSPAAHPAVSSCSSLALGACFVSFRLRGSDQDRLPPDGIIKFERLPSDLIEIRATAQYDTIVISAASD
jgi:hypothetical protein